jgi:hypothetical protein
LLQTTPIENPKLLSPLGPIDGLDISEISRSEGTVAAWWCLLRGSVRRAGERESIVTDGVLLDMTTFLNRCESLGSLCDRASSVLTMWKESPASAMQYTRAWQRTQQELIWRRGHDI